MDVVSLTQNLIRYPSVSPHGAGCIEFIEDFLRSRGFTCQRYDRHETQNLYAWRGEVTPKVCFVGHVDVVPPGDAQQWRHPPFAAEVSEGSIWGRGAVDMKGAIAVFLSLLDRVPAEQPLSLLVTSDEEADARDGIQYAAPIIFQDSTQIPELFLVGEPTSEHQVGDTLKVGRRGSLNGRLVMRGIQGHVAYPQKADNPLPRLIEALGVLQKFHWDEGDAYFTPTHFEIASIDVGNPATNVIPAEGSAIFNLRFNTRYQGKQLEDLIRGLLAPHMAERDELTFRLSGEPFISKPYRKQEEIVQALHQELGFKPQLSTSGGTSDARFLHVYAPVIELGLRNDLAHQVDERVSGDDLHTLTRCYGVLLEAVFSG
ncbi:MAG: succinyl-diaminopimelate desuccinylase [Holosporales bacterium]